MFENELKSINDIISKLSKIVQSDKFRTSSKNDMDFNKNSLVDIQENIINPLEPDGEVDLIDEKMKNGTLI